MYKFCAAFFTILLCCFISSKAFITRVRVYPFNTAKIVCWGDYHTRKQATINAQQQNQIIEYALKLKNLGKKVLIIAEDGLHFDETDPSLIKDNAPAINTLIQKYDPAKLPGVPFGLVAKCQNCKIPFRNVEFRHLLIGSLANEPFTATQILTQYHLITKEISEYKNSDVTKVYKNILRNQYECLYSFKSQWEQLCASGKTVQAHMNEYSTSPDQKERDFIDHLQTFSHTLIEARILQAIEINHSNFDYILICAGNGHIDTLADIFDTLALPSIYASQMCKYENNVPIETVDVEKECNKVSYYIAPSLYVDPTVPQSKAQKTEAVQEQSTAVVKDSKQEKVEPTLLDLIAQHQKGKRSSEDASGLHRSKKSKTETKEPSSASEKEQPQEERLKTTQWLIEQQARNKEKSGH